MDTINKEAFLDICFALDEFYNKVRVDFIGEKKLYNQATYDQVLVEDYLYVGLAMCIYLNIVPYETLTDEAVNGVMEMFTDYVEAGYIQE